MLLLLTLTLPLQSLPTDTARVYHAAEVVVSATRTPVNAEDSPQRVDRFNIREMNSLGVSSASDIMSLAPGVFVKDYGPAQLSTISIRGTAAEENLYLLNGVRLNGIENGLVDNFLLPSSELGSIEILHGSASALYGADAMGGVVNMNADLMKAPGVGIDFGIGSYGGERLGADLSQNVSGTAITIAAHQERSRNDYDFSFDDGSRTFAMTRTGADYLKRDEIVTAAIPTWNGYTSVLVQNVDADRGTPGAVTGPNFAGSAREIDKNTVALLQNSGTAGLLDYSASVGTVYGYLNYFDPSLTTNGKATNDYYKMLSIQPQIQFSYGDRSSKMFVGIDGESDRAESSEMSEEKTRARVGLFGSGTIVFNENNDFETRIFPAVRFDNYSDFGSSTNPSLGINVKPVASIPVHIRANVGTAFRPPTFNELYYSIYGNPDLKPETSTNYEAGLVFNPQNAAGFFLDAGYYDIETRNGIVWLPQSATAWVPQNYSRISSRGVELSAQGNWNAIVTLRGSYSVGKSLDLSNPSDPSSYMKQLIYIPEEQATLLAAVSPSVFKLSVLVRYVGFRFFTQSNDQFLPSFTTTDLSASAKFKSGRMSFEPILKIENLFNLNYQVLPQYPAPLRTFNFDLEIKFDQSTGEAS